MRYLFLILSCVGLAGYAQTYSIDANALKYANTITGDDLKKHLTILASDEYEGRETCKKGQEMASQYIMKHYEGLGLKPFLTNDRFRQPLPIIIQDPKALTLKLGDKPLEHIEEYLCPSGMKDGEIRQEELLFAGYGIDHARYSDYENLDAKGKILVVLDNEPVGRNGKSLVSGDEDPSEWTQNPDLKRSRARKAGALGLIVIRKDMLVKVDKWKKRLKRPRMFIDYGKDNAFHFLSVHLSNDAAVDAFKDHIDFRKVARTIKKTGQTFSLKIPVKFELKAKGNIKSCESANMIASIEGTTHKNEYLFITSHYDHIGIINGKINNGADDDGSGTVGVLEIAEAFKKAADAGFRPKRTIVFLNFAGEEKGLLGSRYFMGDPPVAPETMVADLNIDMIGRLDKDHTNNPDYVYVIGSDRISTELHELSENVNKAHDRLELNYKYNDEKDPNRYYYRSDHFNFASKGVPVIFYFNGVHADYHKPTDTVDKIHFGKMEKITRLVFLTAWEIANRDKALVRDVPAKEQ